MKKHILFWMLFICAIAMQAQDLHLSGLLLDATTQEPVPGVTILVRGTVTGAISDGNGEFRLTTKGREATLEISHIGYKKQFVTVRRGDGPVTVQLAPRDVRIEDVVIHGDGIRRVFEDKTLHIFDYAFSGDDMIVILHDPAQNRPILALVDARDSIIDTDPGVEKPYELFTDCMGNVHALGDEFACQLHVKDGKIMMYKDPISKFEEVVKPCLANLQERFYYKRIRYNGQMAEYISYDAAAGSGVVMEHIMNKEKIHQLLDPHQDNIYGGLFSSAEELYYLTDKEWEQIGKLNKDFMFYQMAMFYPIPAHLKIIDNRVHIFDHTNGQILKYNDQEEKVVEVPISYHKLPKWRKDDILVDEVLGDAYALYKDGTWRELRQIDLETGELLNNFEIPMAHVRKITVRDGVIYFMYREANYDHTLRLYRWQIQ